MDSIKLSNEELIKYGFIDKNKKGENRRSKEQEKVVKKLLDEIKKMDKEGRIIQSKYGKIDIDIDNKVPGRIDSAVAYGCQGYLLWNPKENSFLINTLIPISDSFLQGKKIREKMWIKPRHDKEPLKLTLREILNILTDGKIRPKGKLKEYLEKEK